MHDHDIPLIPRAVPSVTRTAPSWTSARMARTRLACSVDGVLNVWVAPRDNSAAAHPGHS